MAQVKWSKIKDMTFGEALEAMKNGQWIRESWWEKGMYVSLSTDLNYFELHSCGTVSRYHFKPREMSMNDWEIAEEPVVNKAFEEWYKQWTFDVMHSKKDMECAFNAGMVKITETFEKSKIEWLDGLIEKLGTVDPNYVVFSRGWESALSNLRRMANGGGYLVNYAVDRSGIGGEVPPNPPDKTKMEWLKGLMDKANQGFDNGETWAAAMAALWNLANEDEPYAKWGTLSTPEPHNLEWAKRMLKEGKRVRERRWSNRDASVIQSSASGRFYLFSQKDDTHPVPYIIEQSSEDSIWEIVE